MSITFDGPNLVIQLGGGDLTYDAQEIYSRWKDWVLAGNGQFPSAFRTIGGDPLGGGVYAGAYYFLNNVEGWRIRPEAFDHELTISGNLFGESSATAVFLPTVGDFQVLIKQVTSSLTQTASGGGSGPSVSDIWGAMLASFATAGSAGHTLSRLLKLAEADEELTATLARLRDKDTGDVLLEKQVAGGQITSVTLTEV